MLLSRTFSVSINHEWKALYALIWRPEFFPRWASGLSKSDLRRQGDMWVTDGPDGPISIRFTDHNDYGIMDHHVVIDAGSEIYVPLRVIPNGDGAEVVLTLFRQPDMDEDRFSSDVKCVMRDLRKLKALIEG
jgi:hypothetical protein